MLGTTAGFLMFNVATRLDDSFRIFKLDKLLGLLLKNHRSCESKKVDYRLVWRRDKDFRAHGAKLATAYGVPI